MKEMPFNVDPIHLFVADLDSCFVDLLIECSLDV